MSAILFDFNGTMIFDSPIVERSWIEFFKRYNIEVTMEELRPYMHGVDPIDTVDHYFPNITRERNSELVDEIEQLYLDLCLEYAGGLYSFAKGLEDFLDKCKEKNIKMTIATAAPLKNVKFFFRTLHLDKWFNYEDVVFCDGSFPGKPNPTIYLMAAKKLNTPIEDCVIFEDAVSGITAAVRSKCKYVFGLTSLLTEKEILDLGADKAINDYTDQEFLFSILEK